MTEPRKQISMFVPLSDWKALRLEAARLGVPMTELVRRWIRDPMTDVRDRQRQADAAG